MRRKDQLMVTLSGGTVGHVRQRLLHFGMHPWRSIRSAQQPVGLFVADDLLLQRIPFERASQLHRHIGQNAAGRRGQRQAGGTGLQECAAVYILCLLAKRVGVSRCNALILVTHWREEKREDENLP